MPRFADPHRCPSCAGVIVGPVCPTCGLRLIGPTAGELFQTLQRADTLLERLRTESVSPAPVEVRAPRTPPVEVRAPHTPPVEVRAPRTPSVEVRAPHTPPVEVRAERASKPRPRAATVPAVLLTLGGISLASGAVVFLAIAWFLLGVGGRTVALVVLTGALAAGTRLAARRDLRAAAETLGTLAALFTGFDLIGARLAWFDATSLRPFSIVAGLVLATAGAAGVVALRDRVRLWGPEVIGLFGLVVAAVAVLATDRQVPLMMGLVMVAGAALAWTMRRAGLPVLAVGALVLGILGWLLLVAYGVLSAVDERAAWSVMGPLGTAGLAAIALAVLSTDRGRDDGDAQARLGRATGQAVAGTVGVWLLVGAAVGWADWFRTPTWALLVVAGVAAAGYALSAGPCRRTGIGVGLTGTVVLLTAATVWTGELAAAIAEAGSHGWGTRFVVASEVPSWSALAGFALLVALTLRLWGRPLHPSMVSVGVLAIGLTSAGAVHWTLVPAGFALVAAAVEGAIAMRGDRQHWCAAAALASVAAVCAAVGSGPESIVWWSAAVVGVVVLLREETPDRVAASALVPVLLAGALLLDAEALELERRWVGLGAIGLVYAAALALRLRAARPALAGGTLVAMLACAAAGATSAGWLAAELTVVAAACAVASILDRSRVEGLTAAAIGLVALWLRLGASAVHTPEAYTLPLAAVVLLVGGWALWNDRSRRTVPTIGSGLALALAPTWTLAVAHPLSSRALVAGLACVALVAMASAARWKAPLLLGAVAGALLALVEIAPYADAVPRWVLLVGIGAGLLTAGVRWEVLATAGRRTWGRVADLR